MTRSKWKYGVIIYWSDEDEAYVAEVPELPGCAADGATYKQAVANVEVVIGEWIDGATEGVQESLCEAPRSRTCPD